LLSDYFSFTRDLVFSLDKLSKWQFTPRYPLAHFYRVARGCLGMFRYDVKNELSQIAVPTLIIAANKDRLTRPDASVYMNEHIPNSQLVMLTPANHQGLLERHKEVNEEATLFIQTLKQRDEASHQGKSIVKVPVL
jgi:pimeloyl-ACP methyl ester carboxylesterase